MNKQTVLILDDDKNSVQSLEENLKTLGKDYKITAAENNGSALAALEKGEADLMILNIQSPGTDGLQFLKKLEDRGIWLPAIITADENIDEESKEFKDFGIVGFFKKPFKPERAAVTIDEILQGRQNRDIIKNFGLPAIMQLIEMEKRTGIITVRIGSEDARIFFKNGKVMDIKVKGLSTEQALEECINSLHEDREIGIEYVNHRKDKKIDISLMQMVMEASRINDEKKISTEKRADVHRDREAAQKKNLSALTDLLNSLKEVESYIIADADGEALAASPGHWREDILNSGVYLWIVGEKIKDDLKSGKPAALIYYRHAKKRLIKKHQGYIMIIDLSGITKFSAFKQKLDELVDRLIFE